LRLWLFIVAGLAWGEDPARALLGRYLFYDTRMSVNGTQSCATCHRQELAFTDGRARPVGATGEEHPRSAMSLVNLTSAKTFTWSNPNVKSLEEQALIPMLSEHPVELGLRVNTFLAEVRKDPVYRPLFAKTFAGVVSLRNIARALAAFERTIISDRSPYDRYYYGGDTGAISEAAQRGQAIFFGNEVAGCFRCHSGSNFSDAAFHNTGLYNVPGTFRYPWPNLGIYSQTRKIADAGKFKTPSLRNVALTAPYMHDGSIATLEEVLDHYAAGGRTISSGPWAGHGHENPYRDERMTGFELTRQNRADLLEFLRSLTDTELIQDRRFSNPW
jgi:cytochrome c peroxidase